MKKSLIALAVMFFTAGLSFAKPAMLNEPKKNEVILVGRISFNTDMNRKWLLEAVDVPEDARKYADIYEMPFASAYSKVIEEGDKAWLKANDTDKDILNFEQQAWAVNGNYFFVKYSLGKERTVYLNYATLFIGASYKLPVLLPLNLKVTVPEGEKFLYLGDFTYNATGFAFEVTGRVDEDFDAAQVALNGVTKKEYALCRANPEFLSADEIAKVQFAYTSPTTDFKKWYKLFKDLPTVEEESTEEVEE